ncbi:MAG: single-stranded DNA-binding protein [Synechococcus sp.]|nr:single-stranded DNA-binding protein [Synechococcus sp.]
MITATISGNVGRAPELKATASGKQMATFSVASTVKGKEGYEPKTTWVEVVCFDEQADVVSQRLQKGDRAVVTGRMGLETFQKKDGTQGFSLRLVADEVGLSLRWPKREKVAAGVDVNDESEVIPF